MTTLAAATEFFVELGLVLQGGGPDYDVQREFAVSRDRLVERCVKHAQHRRGRVVGFAWRESDARLRVWGVIKRAMSRPRFIHVPSNVFGMLEAIDDFPDRGAPLRITTWPDPGSLMRRGNRANGKPQGTFLNARQGEAYASSV